MINQTGKGAYGYVALAHAIIDRGEKENDQLFLNSEWYQWLLTFCKIGDAHVLHRQKTNQAQVNYV